jgi:xanthine/CO dehydrogenase XdhC/CoxF family maturation factor
MLDVLNALVKAIESLEPVALTTVIDVQGASPARVGFKLLVRADGGCVGNVGGGELEKRIREAAREALVKGSANSLGALILSFLH